MLTKRSALFWFVFGLAIALVDMFFDWTGEFTIGVAIGMGVMGLAMVWAIGNG